MIRVRCPASCGEIFQGMVEGEEALISYAIDLYSVISLEKGKRRTGKTGKNLKKAYHAMEETLKYFDCSPDFLKDYRLVIDSDIPTGKGMASSTADVAGAVMLSARMIEQPITEEILGRIAATIEPTDSTLFSELSLFHNKSGKRLRSYGPYPKGRVFILEGAGTVNTLEYHRKHRERKKSEGHRRRGQADHLNPSAYAALNDPRQGHQDIFRAFEAWERHPEKGSLKEIGRLSTVSARTHQRILPKPGLEEIIEESLGAGAYGVNTAHSGSVLGVLYDEGCFDKEDFIRKMQKQGLMKDYPRIRDHRLIPGGLQWVK